MAKRAGFILCLVVCALGVGASHARADSPPPPAVIAAGVQIGSVDVSGLTAEQATAAVDHAYFAPVVLHVGQPSITICFLAKPVDFEAIDDKPVTTVFLLVTPTVRSHLYLLSRLSERGAQERSVLRVMPAAREADLTGPRVALALSTFAEEDLETFGAFPQDDHHRGRGFRLQLGLREFERQEELAQPFDRRLAHGEMATVRR